MDDPLDIFVWMMSQGAGGGEYLNSGSSGGFRTNHGLEKVWQRIMVELDPLNNTW